MRHALFALMLAPPALAGECPDPPDHGAALSDLFAEVQAAETERQAQQVANRMWALWADAPDPQAQDWLDEGMTRREAYDFTGALKAFDAVIAYCPDYAEGYNQRAFVNFIRQDYEAALPDLDHALARQPRHVAAMTGRALTLIALDRKPEAALELRRALTLNPWLQERHLLPALEAAEEEL